MTVLLSWGGGGRQLGCDALCKILADYKRYFRVPLGVSRITEVVIEVLNFLFLIGMVTVIF